MSFGFDIINSLEYHSNRNIEVDKMSMIKVLLVIWVIGYVGIVIALLIPPMIEYMLHDSDTTLRKITTFGRALVFWMFWPILVLCYIYVYILKRP